jgi:hypothetical protein
LLVTAAASYASGEPVLNPAVREPTIVSTKEATWTRRHLRDGKTHRAYLWSYCSTRFNPITAVVFDFAHSRGGQHVRGFLGLDGSDGWKGKLVTDDFSGYKACFELGVTEVGCMAHARRKFHELWANHGSPLGEQALKFFIQLYDIEREVADLDADQRREARRR